MREFKPFCKFCGEVGAVTDDVCRNCLKPQSNLKPLPEVQPEINIMAQNNTTPFAPGVRMFDKHPNAPDFVLASMVIGLDELFQFVSTNPQMLADYQGKKQLKLQILRSQAGAIYATVDTYGTPAQQAQAPAPAPAPVANGWGGQPAQQAPPPQYQQPAQQPQAGGWGAQPAQQPPAGQPAQPSFTDKLPF